MCSGLIVAICASAGLGVAHFGAKENSPTSRELDAAALTPSTSTARRDNDDENPLGSSTASLSSSLMQPAGRHAAMSQDEVLRVVSPVSISEQLGGYDPEIGATVEVVTFPGEIICDDGASLSCNNYETYEGLEVRQIGQRGCIEPCDVPFYGEEETLKVYLATDPLNVDIWDYDSVQKVHVSEPIVD